MDDPSLKHRHFQDADSHGGGVVIGFVACGLSGFIVGIVMGWLVWG